MEVKQEYYQNFKDYKLCMKIFNRTFIVCGCFAGFLAAVDLFLMVLSLFSNVSLLANFFSLLCNCGYLALALYGNYAKKIHMTLAAPILPIVLSIVLDYDSFELALSMIAITSAALIVWAIKKYDYLEQQEGFPHFNHLLDEADNASREAQYHNNYADKLKEWKSASTEDMGEVHVSGIMEKRQEVKNDFMGAADISQAGSDLSNRSAEKPRDYYAEMREKEMKEKIRLAKLDKMAEHAEMMRKNEKLYRLPLLAYVLMCIPCILTVPFLVPLFKGEELAYALTDALVFKTAALICGFLGVKKRHDILCVSAPVILLLNSIIVRTPAIFWLFSITKLPINIVYFIISAAVCAVNLAADSKYRYLEQQYGFPYFSKRMLNTEPDEAVHSSVSKPDRTPESAVNDMGVPQAVKVMDKKPEEKQFMDEI